MRTTFKWMTALTAVLFAAGFLLLAIDIHRQTTRFHESAYPMFPRAWADVRVGQTRTKVHLVLGEKPVDARSTKGCEMLFKECDRGYWRLNVVYEGDEPERVRDVDYQFIDRSSGARFLTISDPLPTPVSFDSDEF
ncbi:MAG: hypothetical protein AAF517_13725 [Planctomycetota bacterium]